MGESEDRAETLRQRIELYRQYLKEGLDTERAVHYLSKILAAERELKKLARDKQS